MTLELRTQYANHILAAGGLELESSLRAVLPSQCKDIEYSLNLHSFQPIKDPETGKCAAYVRIDAGEVRRAVPSNDTIQEMNMEKLEMLTHFLALTSKDCWNPLKDGKKPNILDGCITAACGSLDEDAYIPLPASSLSKTYFRVRGPLSLLPNRTTASSGAKMEVAPDANPVHPPLGIQAYRGFLSYGVELWSDVKRKG